MSVLQENTFPTSGFVRLPQIVGDARAKPPTPPLIPVGRSTWWRWVRDGKAPSPIKLGSRTTAWLAEDVLAFVERLRSDGSPQ